MNDVIVLVLALALVLVLSHMVQHQDKQRVETLVAMPQSIAVSPQTKELLDRAIVYFVVSGYLKAAHSMTTTNKVKPMCVRVVEAARSNVAATLKVKLKPLRPVAREALIDTSRKLMRHMEKYILSRHCGPGGNKAIKNMEALTQELQQLSAAFNSGVQV